MGMSQQTPRLKLIKRKEMDRNAITYLFMGYGK
jgi:hypothetical protein